MKTFIKKLAITLACLLLSFTGKINDAVAADPPIYSSTNFRVELLNFGTENLLTSIADSIPPTITSSPTVTDVSEGAITKVIITWTTDKPSSSIVLVGPTTSYGSDYGNTSELVTSHSVTVTGLTAGTSYHYKVRSIDSVGNIGESADATFSAGDSTAPSISNLSVSILESTYAIITWTTNENANSIIEYGTTTAYGTQIGQSDESVTSHTVRLAGLLPQTTYHFRARSKDASGNTGISGDISLTTGSTPAISDVRITDITLNSAVISWTTNQSATTELTYGTTTQYGLSYADEAKIKNHTVRLTNLTSGTTYHFRIRGTDVTGLILSSDDYSFTTVILPIITDVRVEDIRDHSVVIRWHSSSKIDELIEYEAISTGLDNVEVLEKKTSGSVDLFIDHVHKLTGLEALTKYRFRIYGKDPFGNQAMTGIMEFETSKDTEPPKITNLRTDTAVDLGNRDSVQVLVSWTTNEPANGYVEYGIGAGGMYTNFSVKDETFTNAKVLVVPKLKAGTSYHLRAVAGDKSGNVGRSDDYLILTPQQGLSLWELIFGKLSESLGWLGDL